MTGGIIRWEIRAREKITNQCPECPDHPAENIKQDMQDMQDIVQKVSPATMAREIKLSVIARIPMVHRLGCCNRYGLFKRSIHVIGLKVELRAKHFTF